MPALSCLCCSACFLDAVGPRGWRDGCGAQVARCIGAGSTRAAGRARSALTPTAMGGAADGGARGRDAGGEARRVQDGGDERGRRAQARWQGARMRQAGQARAAGRKACSAMPRVACRCRMAQSPFGRTAGRCRGKAARRWQHLRTVRDFGFLDAKEGPWRQDSRAMYPESPDCAREWMHGARMLPS